jgi:hypothetical protein
MEEKYQKIIVKKISPNFKEATEIIKVDFPKTLKPHQSSFFF